MASPRDELHVHLIFDFSDIHLQVHRNSLKLSTDIRRVYLQKQENYHTATSVKLLKWCLIPVDKVSVKFPQTFKTF